MCRRTPAAILLFCLGVSVIGCEDVDWNWEALWWKQPRRVVRPTRSAEPMKTARATEPASQAGADRAASAEAASTEPSSPVVDLESVVAGPVQPASVPERPYYHLYLLGRGHAAPVSRGESQYELRRAGARSCARLLEMLYVPIGRSGSDSEAYLIYEQRGEFERAKAFAPWLDIEPRADPGDATDPESTWRAGVAGFLHILDEGAIVDRALIGACERRLVQAGLSAQLPTKRRWAAAVLAGKLAADYRYDYPAARQYYQRAGNEVRADSIEHMTADWWLADTFVHEGNTREADRVYEEMLDLYADLWPGSRILSRSREILKAHRKGSG